MLYFVYINIFLAIKNVNKLPYFFLDLNSLKEYKKGTKTIYPDFMDRNIQEKNMSFSRMGDKTRVVADVHGDFEKLRLLDENHPVDSLIVAGDIGYTGSKENCDKITRMFSDAFARHFFIDGNHDNYDALLKEGCQTEMLTYLSRGQIFQDGLGRDWLCIGGAESVDREIRQRRGFYWSPSEILTTEEASMIIKEVSDIDIYGVISHDCPSQFEIKNIDDTPLEDKLTFFKKMGWNMTSGATRANLGRIFQAIRPVRWIFGHYHLYQTGVCEHCKWTALAPLEKGIQGTEKHVSLLLEDM